MNQKPLVSINLLTYNGLKFLESCANAVFRQTYQNIEFLIIDNKSTDGTTEKIEELFGNNTQVKIHKLRSNLGFAAGHNYGIKQAKGEIIICLNQDAILADDFTENILKPFNDKKVAAVQAKTMRLKDSDDKKSFVFSDLIDSTGLVILKNRRIINRGQGEKDNRQYDKTEEIFGVDGAVPAYRRTALEDIKINGEYFDELFFMYKEDVDLAWRLRLGGWKAIFEPNAKAYHFRGAGESAATNYFAIIRERLKISNFAKYYSFKNQRLMQIKNETLRLFFKYLPQILTKEIGSWFYVLAFEPFFFKAVRQFFKEIPATLEKRKIIMSKKRVSDAEIKSWFK